MGNSESSSNTVLGRYGVEKLKGKKVFLRLDLNVPQDVNGEVTDDSRIVASLPTIKFLKDAGAKIIIATHLGRPKAKVTEAFRLNPVAKRLSELLGAEVIKLDEAIGPKVEAAIANLRDGDLCLLENIRFYAGEEANDPEFAKELAKLADIYVNDAFGTAHRAHASTAGVAAYLRPALPGFLMEKELEMLGTKLQNPERPFTAVIGGSKISSKIIVLKELIKKVDVLIIGGGMAFTFVKAQGGKIGQSICEDDQIATAKEILEAADQQGTAIILPKDSIAVTAVDNAGARVDIFKTYATNAMLETKVLKTNAITDDMQAMDIGPETAKEFAKLISQSRTVLWNGPVGVFEYDSLERGTRAVAQALKELSLNGGTTIIGGGDSVAAIEKFGFEKTDFSHVSTGGGASLEFIEGKVLPGVACLDLEPAQV